MSHNDNLVAENPDQEHRISFFTFNGKGLREICFNAPLSNDLRLSRENFQPNDNTPLFDAMGKSILRVKHLTYGLPNQSVLVTILTDGMENASREFTGKEIKELVNSLKTQGWAFVYHGTDHDVDEIADLIGIHRGSRKTFSKMDILASFFDMEMTRKGFSERLRKGESLDDDLLKNSTIGQTKHD
jgi:hypothetical protein